MLISLNTLLGRMKLQVSQHGCAHSVMMASILMLMVYVKSVVRWLMDVLSAI